MPLQYRLDSSTKCVLAVGTEPFVDDDLIQYQMDLANDPDHGAGFDQLIDLTEVRPLSLSAAGIVAAGRLSDSFEEHVRETRLALVVASSLAYGLGRMFEARVSRSVQVRVFQRLEDAEAWLRTPLPAE